MDYELIKRYLEGKTSVKEEADLLYWIQESDENKRFFSVLTSNISLHRNLSREIFKEDTDSALQRLNARIDAEKKNSHTRRHIISWSGWAVAAVCATLLLWPNFKPAPQQKEFPLTSSYVNSTAAVKQINLGDGTKVILTPGAKIDYNVSDYNDRRLVRLYGEAYFDVAKNNDRPFTVAASNIKILVTGTSFSVNAGENGANTEVILERGSIKLLNKDDISLVSVKPNQKASISENLSEITIEEIYSVPYITEKYSLVSIMNANARDIISRIEKIYGVEISSSELPSDKRYDINFLKSDNLSDVLKVVEYLTGEKLTITSGIN